MSESAEERLRQLAETKLEEFRALAEALARLRDDELLPVDLEEQLEEWKIFLREG